MNENWCEKLKKKCNKNYLYLFHYKKKYWNCKLERTCFPRSSKMGPRNLQNHRRTKKHRTRESSNSTLSCFLELFASPKQPTKHFFAWWWCISNASKQQKSWYFQGRNRWTYHIIPGRAILCFTHGWIHKTLQENSTYKVLSWKTSWWSKGSRLWDFPKAVKKSRRTLQHNLYTSYSRRWLQWEKNEISHQVWSSWDYFQVFYARFNNNYFLSLCSMQNWPSA